MDRERYAVSAERLRWTCDPNQFPFECTGDLTPLQEFIGQNRAIKSIEFGLAMEHPGYNIFVTGLTGTGKTSAIKAHLQRVVAERGEKAKDHHLNDWCYIHNFADPDRPLTVDLPQGKGRVLRSHIEDLLKNLKIEITRAFSSEEYSAQRRAIAEEGQSTHHKMFQDLEKEAFEEGFLLQTSPMGVMLIPHVQGTPLSQPEYMALDEERRKALDEKRSVLMEQVGEAFSKARSLERETVDKIKELDRRAGDFATSALFAHLLEEHKGSQKVTRYLQDLQQFALDNIPLFYTHETPAPPSSPPTEVRDGPGKDPFLAFRVNVFVDNSRTSGPPIIIETNPTYGNLFGKIERRAYMGAYFSDHTMLKPGAVALANLGYLVLNASDLLMNPGAWEGLKRTIKTKEVRLEDPNEQFGFGFSVPVGLKPEPMPADLKVVVIGDNRIYGLLSLYDEDFWEIFKVKADFDSQIPRSPDNLESYSRFICATCAQDGLLSFDRTGVAKVVEYGAKLVGDQEKLSSRFGQIRDILIEADYWARQKGHELVSVEDVQQALDEKIYRVNLIEERLRELIGEGTLMLDVDGEVVGQVNGLAVIDMGDFSFGRPSRITAKTFMGRSGVINIERESQLSGKIHDKGVLILSGYLGWKYAQDKPLSLSASLCFEQSYEGVEGDSASSTELYSILSSLSELPIKQNIAVTGSVNQKGEVQPIGGVNQKIEGFFDVCKAKGLIGEQGVLIPHSNIRHLMLREDVVEAVRAGKFHIYGIKTIDEGIEILTGREAGERGADGSYPEGTVNHLVNRRLKELAEGLRSFAEMREGRP